MVSCRDLSAAPCGFCAKTYADSTCWINQWQYDFIYNHRSDEFCEINFLILVKLTDDKYIYYFLQALKLYKPELIEKFNKLLILR
jgi:hypothetical protein